MFGGVALPQFDASTKLLENQLRNAVQQQQNMAHRLINSAIQEIEINANKLQLARTFQTAIVNSLANKGSNDVSILFFLPHSFFFNLKLFAHRYGAITGAGH